jgi:hypothetical protein
MYVVRSVPVWTRRRIGAEDVIRRLEKIEASIVNRLDEAEDVLKIVTDLSLR